MTEINNSLSDVSAKALPKNAAFDQALLWTPQDIHPDLKKLNDPNVDYETKKWIFINITRIAGIAGSDGGGPGWTRFKLPQAGSDEAAKMSRAGFPVSALEKMPNYDPQSGLFYLEPLSQIPEERLNADRAINTLATLANPNAAAKAKRTILESIALQVGLNGKFGGGRATRFYLPKEGSAEADKLKRLGFYLWQLEKLPIYDPASKALLIDDAMPMRDVQISARAVMNILEDGKTSPEEKYAALRKIKRAAGLAMLMSKDIILELPAAGSSEAILLSENGYPLDQLKKLKIYDTKRNGLAIEDY